MLAQFYLDIKFCKNFNDLSDKSTDFLKKAWISASKAYLTRQHARTIEDLIDYKGLLKDLDKLNKTLGTSSQNLALKDYNFLENSKAIVQGAFLKASKHKDSVFEEEVRLLEEQKLYTFLELKSD